MQPFFKIGHIRNFLMFVRKYQCWSLFLENFIKKYITTQVFSWEYNKVFENSFLYGTPPMIASENG